MLQMELEICKSLSIINTVTRSHLAVFIWILRMSSTYMVEAQVQVEGASLLDIVVGDNFRIVRYVVKYRGKRFASC